MPSSIESQRHRIELASQGQTVVANQRRSMDAELIKWAKTNGKLVRVSRPGKWGNPFETQRRTREEHERVCQEYREWIEQQPELMAAIPSLKGMVLLCWCHPLPCHGDVLAELANRAIVPQLRLSDQDDLHDTAEAVLLWLAFCQEEHIDPSAPASNETNTLFVEDWLFYASIGGELPEYCNDTAIISHMEDIIRQRSMASIDRLPAPEQARWRKQLAEAADGAVLIDENVVCTLADIEIKSPANPSDESDSSQRTLF